jgi:hypothetical protein
MQKTPIRSSLARPEGPRAGNREILNVHPVQPPVYIATAANVPITEDYAVVALEQGINPEHSELVLAERQR